MHINELINPASLQHDIAEGFIRVKRHPSLPLSIYNYSEKAQFAKHWNLATMNCRGLIVHDDGRIVARPFPKFFNWDEPKPKGSRFKMGLDEPAVVTDKMDGSLGILYHEDSGGHSIATRGSFTSDQAIHATHVWQERYADEFGYRMNSNLTYLFEIIYPENRIVVDYGPMDDLVLLGAVDIRSGHVYPPDWFPGWPGPSAQVYAHRTLSEAVQAKPRTGKEGFVVTSLSDNLMVKVKHEDYVRLHRIVTGLNEKEIWRRCMEADLQNGPEIDKMELVLRDIPDEFHDWAIGVVQGLTTGIRLREQQVQDVWVKAQNEVDPGTEWRSERGRRKALAFWLNDELGAEGAPYKKGDLAWLRSGVFQIYDGHDPRHMIWKLAEPKGDVKK